MTYFSIWDVSRDEIVRSLSKEINTTLQSNLRLKYLKQKRRSWILTYTKARDSTCCTHAFQTNWNISVYTISSCHPPGVKRGFTKGEALRLLRTNSSKTLFEEMIKNFKKQLQRRGTQKAFLQNTLSEVNFEDRKLALQQKRRENKRISPFVRQYRQLVANLKQMIMNKWYFIKKQP